MHTSRPVIPDDAQLEWLIAGNPKHIGSRAWERFEKSFGALTVAEYKARRQRRGLACRYRSRVRQSSTLHLPSCKVAAPFTSIAL
jgi:hypothetical protein